jgi:hypothetical protein
VTRVSGGYEDIKLGSGGHGCPRRSGRVQSVRCHFPQMRDSESGLSLRGNDDEREQIVNPTSKSIRIDILTCPRSDLEICCPGFAESLAIS